MHRIKFTLMRFLISRIDEFACVVTKLKSHQYLYMIIKKVYFLILSGYHYTNLTGVSECVRAKGHRKLFDPTKKSRFLYIVVLRRYTRSRLKQLATARAKY